MITELTARIEEWARERGQDTASPDKQMLKLGEEYGELCQGLAKNRPDQVKDSIGDMYVVLTILSLQLGLDIEDCVMHAYGEIKNRKARFKTVISLVIDGQEIQFEGIVNGHILEEKRGKTGFGYDPHHPIVRASQEGLSSVLFKPFQVERLVDEVKKALAAVGA